MKKVFSYLLGIVALTGIAQAQHGDTRCVSVTPTVSASPDYTTGDVLGTLMTFSSIFPSSVNTGLIASVQVRDKSGQNGNADLVLFDSNPTASTFTDNAAIDVDDGDLSKVIAVVNLGTSSSFAFANSGTKYLGSLAVPVRGVTSTGALSTSLYGILVARATINLASASDIVVTVCNLAD